ncbi:hypothetical protein K458DRAFT_390549 [Lentithecium fluviatile CBS 122367]|uniref:Protein phosphatase n=1 Tax=Lentithecium fluviatile CBS 122367 TaxID=1168545 RepID=A0A6G1IWJ4_9PLEO|nr:hypothetical protein K458DRAFT_390549 [Lentithecium fluviatile CBS 122367]
MIPRPRTPTIGVLLQHFSVICRTQRPHPQPCLRVLPQVRFFARPARETSAGTTTPVPENAEPPISKPPFYFEAGYALFAKRPSRPFPPPFLSMPSTSFSEPLSTHHKSRDRRPQVNGEMIRGVTNGDDAVLVSDNFIGANDGVGAWATREKGHAAYVLYAYVFSRVATSNHGSSLWSRLILHFWSVAVEHAIFDADHEPDPVAYLQTAFEQTKQATSEPNEWHGTTTACAALLSADKSNPAHPIVYVTQLGDSQILVIRPKTKDVLFKTKEQWHWFDCPRQLGTNSPDTPEKNAVMDRVEIEEDDVIVAMSDGVVDNLWEHEIVENVVESLRKWKEKSMEDNDKAPAEHSYADGMRFVAQELVKAARAIAEDPFAESPYMEKAIDEGLSIEGGKLDDISVVAAQCKRRKT